MAQARKASDKPCKQMISTRRVPSARPVDWGVRRWSSIGLEGKADLKGCRVECNPWSTDWD